MATIAVNQALERLAAEPLPRALHVLHRALERWWRLSPPAGDVRVVRGLQVPMRDGVILRADVYLPPGAGRRPTLLMRSPYGRGWQFVLALALPYAARGYAVVLQSVRGTFGSGGEFQPVVNEAHDGQDTVAWLRRQPWFDGSLATVGPSYLGYAQWALALDPPPELRAMVVHVGPHDLARAGMDDGAFQLLNLATWTELIAHQEHSGPIRATLRMLTAEQRLAPKVRRLPLQGLADRLGGTPCPWFDEWLQHPDLADPYWERYRATAALRTTTVPTLLIGGWQDWFLEQTLEQYAALRARGVDVALTVGPWAHLSMEERVVAAESLEWLNRHLPAEAAASPQARKGRVHVYVTGLRGWRSLPDWPPATTARTWYLASGGRLADRPSPVPNSVTEFSYDPMHPTPSVGGRLLIGGTGRRDNRRLEARADVRTFTSPPLAEPVEVLGAPTVQLFCESDNPYSDVFVRLCDVDPAGRSLNVTDRLLRLDPAAGEDPGNAQRKLWVTLPGTAHRFLRGHRIRLQVSGGAHPRYARNLGAGEPLGQGTAARGVNHRILHDVSAPSSVRLPVPGR